MAQGGYQQPTNPAPVSGPGRLSKRTDGGPANPTQPKVMLPDAAYGEQQTFQDAQAAPMAASPDPGQMAPGPQPVDLSGVVPFNAPTSRPEQPVTSGADAGAGPGFSSLGLNQENDPAVQRLRDSLPALELMANLPNSGFAFRQFVRRVRAMM